MPYRPPSPRQRDAQARKLATMRAGRDRARMASPAPDYPPVLPELRRARSMWNGRAEYLKTPNDRIQPPRSGRLE